MGAYSVRVRFSEEDKAFIAEVPELPGCAADGDTPEAAVAALRGVAESWLEAAEKLGRLGSK